MSVQDPRYPNCSWLMPYLMARDVAKSVEFYQSAFGLILQGPPLKGPDGAIQHAELKHPNGDVVLMIGAESSATEQKSPATTSTVPPVTLYMYVPDVDDHYLKARAAGARILQPPADMFYGDRRYSVVDPDGYHWGFATHTGKFSDPPHS